MGGVDVSLVEMLGLAFSIVFLAWPVVLLSALQSRGRVARGFVAMWSALGVARGLAMLEDSALGWSPIPEPWYTAVFLAVGAVVWPVWLAQRARRRKALLDMMASVGGATDLQALSGDQLEDLVTELFKRRGHKARRVGGPGDHGVDVEVGAADAEKWIVQCKKRRRRLGEPAIRDFYGAMQHANAHKGVIVATGGFTGPARRWARGKPLILCDGELFIKWWAQALKKEPSES